MSEFLRAKAEEEAANWSRDLNVLKWTVFDILIVILVWYGHALKTTWDAAGFTFMSFIENGNFRYLLLLIVTHWAWKVSLKAESTMAFHQPAAPFYSASALSYLSVCSQLYILVLYIKLHGYFSVQIPSWGMWIAVFAGILGSVCMFCYFKRKIRKLQEWLHTLEAELLFPADTRYVNNTLINGWLFKTNAAYGVIFAILVYWLVR